MVVGSALSKIHIALCGSHWFKCGRRLPNVCLKTPSLVAQGQVLRSEVTLRVYDGLVGWRLHTLPLSNSRKGRGSIVECGERAGADSCACGLSHPLGADLMVAPLHGRPGDAKCRVFSLLVLRERVIERRTKDVLRMSGEVCADGQRKIVVAGVGHGVSTGRYRRPAERSARARHMSSILASLRVILPSSAAVRFTSSATDSTLTSDA